MRCAPLALSALIAFALPAAAVVVNFDFNRRLSNDSNVGTSPPLGETYQGLGAAPDLGGNTYWNSVRRTSSSSVSSAASVNNGAAGGGPIRDSAGLTTTVDVILSGTGTDPLETTIGHAFNPDQQERGGPTVPLDNLMGDYLQLDAPGSDSAGNLGTVNGTINGLTAGASYEIYFYGQGANYNVPGSTTSGANSFFAITSTLGGSIIGSGQQTGWDGVIGGNGTLAEGVEYVKFAATANASGEIFFIWQNVMAGPGGNVITDAAPDSGGGSSDLAALNAIQVVSVPEPSAVALIALGALGLLRRRR